MSEAPGRCKYLLLVGLGAASVWGCTQRLEKLSYDGLMERCAKASQAKPYRISSSTIKGPQGQSAQTKVVCWRESDARLALSELWVDGKKVYETPRAALAREHHCGSAAGEIYRPHSFSPNGSHFAFLLTPFCWETEPLAPVVMLHRRGGQGAKAPNFRPIAQQLFDANPKAAANKQNIDFDTSIAGWEGTEELLIDVRPICYGCFEEGRPLTFARTRWGITPEDEIRFVEVGY